MVPLCTQTAVSCPAILLWHRTVAGAPATDSEVFGRASEGWPPGVGCGAVEQAGRARSVARPSKQARRARGGGLNAVLSSNTGRKLLQTPGTGLEILYACAPCLQPLCLDC